MGEVKKMFPVYQFIVSYEENGEKKSIKFAETMRKQELTDEECAALINELMVPFMQEYPRAEGKITLLELKIDRMATWRLIWFSHETFQVFENEAEAFKSFRKFVNASVKECHATGTDPSSLMDADEEARWTICDCEDCKKTGRTVINH